jgi:hypothetical protein
MGLLDEAIREHLELKRRRGADPEEVAREQQEALDPISAPVPAAEGSDSADASASDEDLPTEEHALETEPVDPHPAAAAAAQDRSHDPSFAIGASAAAGTRALEPDETAELDMSTVLDEDSSAPAEPHASGEDAREATPADTHERLERRSTEGAAGPEHF